MKKHRDGFNLIELSIVLVVIGLIVGGILVGQDLIKNSEIRAILTDVDKYRAAILTFRGKYRALPGDIANAGDFFTGCTTINPATCSGNGDDSINTYLDGSGYHNEEYILWNELAWAGMMAGKSDYVWNTNNAPYAGVEVPLLRNITALEVYAPNESVGPTWWPAYPRSGHSFVLDWIKVSLGTMDGVFTPLEALDIDTKLDDGIRAQGKVQGEHTITGTASRKNCVNAGGPGGYNITYLSRTDGCQVRIAAGF